jgi:transcription antitermination factor NusG
MKYALAVLILAAALSVSGVSAQTAVPARLTGTVTEVNASANQVSLKSDKGETVALALTPRSFIFRLPPGETDTKKAVKIAIGDLAVGDRVAATYQESSDQKITEARTLLVMSKADVAEVHLKEEEDWKKRGTTGIVTAIDPASKVVTIKVGSKETKVEPSEKTEFFRYSPDSAQFSDAKPSVFADIKPGDQLKVLGDKTADGDVKAEKVVSGAFRQLAATVKAIDAATGEITVMDLATKKPLAIRVTADSSMKKLTDQMAQTLARRYGAGRGAARGPQAAPDQAGQRGGGGAGRGPGGGGPGGPGGRGGDIGQMIEQLPPIHVADLKPGDAIMVQTTIGSATNHPTAVTLLAGVEPILTAAPNSTRDIMSGWNLGGGGGGEGN